MINNKIKYTYNIPSKEQFNTKSFDGKNISFDFELDTENVNRGWVVNILTMFMDGLQAGYMKISYIPQSHWDYFYSDNILKWMVINNNTYIEYQDEEPFEYQCKVISDFLMNYNQLNEHIYLNDFRKGLLNKQKIQELFDIVVKTYNELYFEEMMKFKMFHVEKPLVDFSRIFNFEETWKYSLNIKEELLTDLKQQIFDLEISKINNPDSFDEDYNLFLNKLPIEYNVSFRNKGYSKYLYEAAMKWVGLNQQELFKGFTNDISIKIWKRLENNQKTKTLKNPYNKDNHRIVCSLKEIS